MGLFDGVLGGAIGAEMATVVNRMIEQPGGLQGLVNEFKQKGFGDKIQSWIGNGPNQAISPSEVHQVVGSQTLQDLASKYGMSSDDLAAKLSQILPTAVDKVTPNGMVHQ